jgi:hypothetical protein
VAAPAALAVLLLPPATAVPLSAALPAVPALLLCLCSGSSCAPAGAAAFASFAKTGAMLALATTAATELVCLCNPPICPAALCEPSVALCTLSSCAWKDASGAETALQRLPVGEEAMAGALGSKPDPGRAMLGPGLRCCLGVAVPPLLPLLSDPDPALRWVPDPAEVATAGGTAAVSAAAAEALLSRLKGFATAHTARRTRDTDSCRAQRRLIILRHTRQKVLHAGNNSMMDNSHKAVTSIASESCVGVLTGLEGSWSLPRMPSIEVDTVPMTLGGPPGR